MFERPDICRDSGKGGEMTQVCGIDTDFMEELFDAVYLVDRARKITYWNRAAEELTGYTREEVIGTRCRDNLLVHVGNDVQTLCDMNCPIDGSMTDGESRESEVYLRHKNGHRVRVSVRSKPLRDAAGEIAGAVEIFRDKSYREVVRERIAELERLALLDPLTRLANRRHVEATLEKRLKEMSRYGWGLGILFIDVDYFKHINDTRGHQIGDDVLRLTAKTMQASLRPFDFLGRWGGDEFVALVVNVSEAELFRIADRMRALVEQSKYIFNGDELDVTISIGAALAARGDTPEDLLARSDRSLYRSKRSGRNRVSSVPADHKEEQTTE